VILRVLPKESPSNCEWKNKAEFVEPNLEEVDISAIGFGSEPVSSEPTIKSTLLEGEVELPDVERTKKLSSGESLHLKLRKASISTVRILPCFLSVEFSADATH
jgi:hypothetical protein